MYPRYRIFFTTISDSRTRKEKLFGKHQEGARKSAERVFGMLFKRFQILYRPSRLWSEKDMNKIVKACIIIYNMIVSHRRPGYTGTKHIRLPAEAIDTPSTMVFLQSRQSCEAQVLYWRSHISLVEDADERKALKQSPVEHIWEQVGSESDKE
jgi:Plant transposon protein